MAAKALNMIDALLRTLCYKRAKGELEISIGVIRHYLALQNLVQFYIEGQQGLIPELAYLPIKAYFETGLPGFNPQPLVIRRSGMQRCSTSMVI